MKEVSASRSLRIVRVVHTIVWAILASSILAIPVFALVDMYGPVLWLTGLVLVEVIVLAINGWQCPLTSVAARYTEDRKDNFDIYLPLWLARHNKLVFGTLFIVGQAIVLLRWRGWIT